MCKIGVVKTDAVVRKAVCAILAFTTMGCASAATPAGPSVAKAPSAFGQYVAQLHARVHPPFAQYLETLGPYTPELPMKPSARRTEVHAVIAGDDGALLLVTVTHSSGSTAFDDAAVRALNATAPFGPPPATLLASDGNFHLHYEFDRNPVYACSDYFARFAVPAGGSSAAR